MLKKITASRWPRRFWKKEVLREDAFMKMVVAGAAERADND